MPKFQCFLVLRNSTTATSKMERFAVIVNGFQPLTIITKRSILDVAVVLDLSLLLLGNMWILGKNIPWNKLISISSWELLTISKLLETRNIYHDMSKAIVRLLVRRCSLQVEVTLCLWHIYKTDKLQNQSFVEVL